MPYPQTYTNELELRGSLPAGAAYLRPVPVDIQNKTFYLAIKRIFDIFFSATALTVLLPFFLLVALIIRLTTKASVLFTQERVGRNGKLFKVYKFRTMKPTAPTDVPTNSLDHADSYITKIGRVLRKTSFDELPQLVNVLKGDMSVIGPRPLIEGESKIHALRTQNGVYQIRPGVTGWAQVNGRDYLTDEEKVALDTEYLRRLSLGFDLRCVARTISVIFTGKGFAEGKK